MDPNQYRNFCSVRLNVWSVGPSEPVVGAILAEVVAASFAGAAGVVAASFAEVVGVAAASFAEVVEVVAAGFAEVAGAVEEAALVAVSLVGVLVFAQHQVVYELEPRVWVGMPNAHQPEMK